MGAADDRVSVLGHWHANLVRIGRWPLVVCVNDRTLLLVLVPGRDFGSMLTQFRARYVACLERLAIPAALIEAEMSATQNIQVDRTDNRSVLGSMNDFVNLIRWRVYSESTLPDADTLEDDLADTPMSALKYALPSEATRTAFLGQ